MTTLTHYPNPADDAYQRAVASAHQKLNHAIVDTHKVRPPVSESWRRCLDLHHKPGRVTSPATISSETLAHYRTSHPLSLVVPMLETLLAPAHAVGLITAVSNTEGHLLWVDGPRQTRAQAESIGFTPGADWSEQSMGTSAPGAALSTGTAAQVAGAEHFSESVHDFYCSAIPLRHPSRGILGMLDITGSPTAVTPLAQAMLTHAAQTVEHYWATHTFPTTTQPPRRLPQRPLIQVAHGHAASLGELRLTARHAEILTLLDWHPDGLTANQLAYELFGEISPAELPARLTTVRAEVSRLRKLLNSAPYPIALHSQPYRLDTDITTDATAAMRALDRGAIAEALQQAPHDVLPLSDAPGIASIRDTLALTLREAVLADATPDELWTFLGRHQAADDVEAWMLALKLLPAHSPRRAIATATLQRLIG